LRIYFAGGESTNHRAQFDRCGITRVAVSGTHLARQVHKNLAGWASQSRFEGREWILYATSPLIPFDPISEVLRGAEVPPEAVIGPVAWIENTWLADSDILFLPVWDGHDAATLRTYTESYDGIVLPDALLDNPMAVRTAKAALPPLKMLGTVTGHTKALEQFDLVVSLAWFEVQKHGETQVWASNRMVRLNNTQKSQRQQYVPAIEALGCDPAAILADDQTEVVRLALRSWLNLEAANGIERPAKAPTEATKPTNGDASPLLTHVANPTGRGRHEILPVVGLTKMLTPQPNADGIEEAVETEVLSVNRQVLRQCDTCSIAMACPGYRHSQTCAYEIPVEIRSKDQLQGVLRAMVEIQAQRVLIGRFGEDLTGQLDDTVGRELDRFFNMVEKWKEIEDSRDTLKMTVEAKGGAHMGVLSRLFGEKVGANAKLLDIPVPSSEVIDVMDDS
jgi:hypothetical protein